MAGRPAGRPLSGLSELPRAARRTLRRHRSRAGALARLHFDPAGVRVELIVAAARQSLVAEEVDGRELSLGQEVEAEGPRVRVSVSVRVRVWLRARVRVRVS